MFCRNETFPYICIAIKRNAQVAELVDALVSNTSGATRAGSIPALGTAKILLRNQEDFFFAFFLDPMNKRLTEKFDIRSLNKKWTL